MEARAERWSALGLLDVEFYAALRGRSFGSEIGAAEDFVRHGMGQRLSPHPFLDVLSLPAEVRRDFRQGKVNSVLRHLTGPDGRVRPVGPVAAPRDPDAMRAYLLTVASRLGGAPLTSPGPASPRDQQPGRTSIVVLSDDSRATLRSVASVVRHAGDRDVEVVVVDRGLPPHVVLGLHAWACGQFSAPRAEDRGWLWTAGATRLAVLDPAQDTVDLPCTGEFVVILDASCEVRRGWLPPLLAPLDDPDVAAVQPLLLQPDDTIAAAGLSAAGTPLLAGHPKEDALRLEGVSVTGISDLAVARRSEQRSDLRHSSGELRVAPTSWVSTSSTDVGSGSRTEVELVETSIDLEVREHSADQLRWCIKLPSPAGAFGDTWGDTHYADAVAVALRRLGQDVVTRRRGAHAAGPIHLDDVSLALRGLHRIPPTPGQRNVLWVISHPEDVDPDEFEGYDLICAASTAWSEEMSARTGRAVMPLLQATEFRRPAGARATSGPDASVVFVGTNLGMRERPLVWQAVEAEIPLTVYGPGWDGLPQGVWQGDYVPNAELPELYRRHGIVLADHWPDMAQRGFIANRVFDAVASGARVISDPVVGLHDVFDPREVAVVRTPEEMRAAVGELRARVARPGPEPAQLWFDDRAQALVDRVSDL